MSSLPEIREKFYKVANRSKFIELGGPLNDSIAENIKIHADFYEQEIKLLLEKKAGG